MNLALLQKLNSSCVRPLLAHSEAVQRFRHGVLQRGEQRREGVARREHFREKVRGVDLLALAFFAFIGISVRALAFAVGVRARGVLARAARLTLVTLALLLAAAPDPSDRSVILPS